jgi:excisionase family DNA binding protein
MDKREASQATLQVYNLQGSSSHRASLLFDNLIWLTTKEAAVYLRKSVNAIHLLVSRGQLKARKFGNRLYFKKLELDYLIETSSQNGGS